MLKFVALIVLLVAIQSCSKENDLPIINEENKIRQAEKLTSTIRVFAVNDSFCPTLLVVVKEFIILVLMVTPLLILPFVVDFVLCFLVLQLI